MSKQMRALVILLACCFHHFSSAQQFVLECSSVKEKQVFPSTLNFCCQNIEYFHGDRDGNPLGYIWFQVQSVNNDNYVIYMIGSILSETCDTTTTDAFWKVGYWDNFQHSHNVSFPDFWNGQLASLGITIYCANAIENCQLIIQVKVYLYDPTSAATQIKVQIPAASQYKM